MSLHHHHKNEDLDLRHTYQREPPILCLLYSRKHPDRSYVEIYA